MHVFALGFSRAERKHTQLLGLFVTKWLATTVVRGCKQSHSGAKKKLHRSAQVKKGHNFRENNKTNKSLLCVFSGD